MDVYFHDKIQQQVSILYHPRDVAALDFKIHKSLEHLDLSANENRYHRKSIITQEDIRKKFQPNRQVLYKYHLDYPKDLDFVCSVGKFDIVAENVFHLRQIYVCDNVYGKGLESPIVEAIKSHEGNKVEKLRNYMKIFKLLNFRQYLEATSEIYSNLVPIFFYENCTDSKLVIDFVCLFNFCWWLSACEKPNILTYILHQAEKIKCTNNLWQSLKPGSSPVNICFLQHKIDNVHVLLMYGIPIVIPPEFNFSRYINIPDQIFHAAVLRGIVSYRRVFLIFLLLYDFQHHQESPQGLQYIWRSIKDPFLSHAELFFTLIPVMPLETIFRVHYHYSTYASEGGCVSNLYPRALKHLCRYVIRKAVYSYIRLP